MGSGKVVFRRIRGKVVPIAVGAHLGVHHALIGAAGGGAAVAVGSGKNKRELPAKTGAQVLGFASNVASGIISGATLFSSWKTALIGQGASVGLDAISASANIASYAGRGRTRERAAQIGKWQAINTAAGYTAFTGVLLGTRQGRTKLLEYGGKGLDLLKRFGSKLRYLA